MKSISRSILIVFLLGMSFSIIVGIRFNILDQNNDIHKSTSNMALKAAWWDLSYDDRSEITIDNTYINELPEGYTVSFSVDTMSLMLSGQLRSDGNDLRIVWYNSSDGSWMELNRIIDSGLNTSDTKILFKLQASIDGGINDTNYYMYYGNPSAGIPPADPAEVYDAYDSFTQSGGPAEGWTPTQGSAWQVVENQYEEDEKQVDRRTILNSYDIENAEIMVKVKKRGAGFGMGIIFRYQDENNFYTAGPGLWDYEIGFGKWTNDNPTLIGHSVDTESVLINDIWYDLKLKILGSNYEVYLNDELKVNINDSEHLVSGKIGLISWVANAKSIFDDLKIRMLVLEEPIVSIDLQVEDKSPPMYNNLLESADPLVLGETEVISIEVVDTGSGINGVYLEYESLNHSMNYIEENKYQYNNWTPSLEGSHPYRIFMVDSNDNWAILIDSVEVIGDYPPVLENLTKSSDPLELGESISIQVDVFDVQGVSEVVLEFDDINYTMNPMVGNGYEYTLDPTSASEKNFNIYARDGLGYCNNLKGTFTVRDTALPDIDNLSISLDPIDVGETEIITVSATDLARIFQIRISYNGKNHTMPMISDDTWQYELWKPIIAGIRPFHIYIWDNNMNYKIIKDNITVIDDIPPNYSNLWEWAPILELGDTERIRIDVSDLSGIAEVLIEFDQINHSMIKLAENKWEFEDWIPVAEDKYEYIIYMRDMNGNWNQTSDQILVEDTTPPEVPVLTNQPTGEISGEIVFDWSDGLDPSGISSYTLIIDNEQDPYDTPGFVFAINITNVGPNSSSFELEEELPPGKYYYFLIQTDGAGHQSSYTSGSFTVVRSTPTDSPLLIIVIVTGAIGSVVSISVILSKRRGKKSSQPRFKIPIHIVISHANKISGPESEDISELPKKAKEKTNLKRDKAEALKIKTDGEKLFGDGAYLEALKKFRIATDLLFEAGEDNLGRFLERRCNQIENLINELEYNLDLLHLARSKNEYEEVLNIYVAIIEISEQLKDIDGVEMYTSELREYYNQNIEIFNDMHIFDGEIGVQEEIGEYNEEDNNIENDNIDDNLLESGLVLEETKLSEHILKIKRIGTELYSEGAYLETYNQFKEAAKMLIDDGMEKEAAYFLDISEKIKSSIDRRRVFELKLEKLKSTNRDDPRILELYNLIIEISRELNDLDNIERYNAEFNEFKSTNKVEIIDVEVKRLMLDRKARALESSGSYKKALELYEKCKELTQILIKLGRNNNREHLNKYNKKIIECQNNISNWM